tara:strand:+ start:2818 stop:3054 length:237 start_codon:yes stop_codon:yes gene_type:complete
MSKDYNPMESMNGWTENKKLVLHRLEEIEHDVRIIEKRVAKLQQDMAVHKAQSRMYAGAVGAIAGLIPALLTLVFNRM